MLFAAEHFDLLIEQIRHNTFPNELCFSSAGENEQPGVKSA
jgi:hypothetical protein